ncbi:MAG TPA: AMP-binding protein [Microbacteriaceae bacterium]|nr:AMP-binding protein [Microbacteriaceae bacterium]
MMPTDDELHDLLDRLERVRAGEPLVIHTSGSTERPKHVALDWAALEAAARASEHRLGACNWLLALPVEYIAGVMVAVRAIVSGTEVRAVGERDFASALAELPAPKCVSLVPNQLDRLLQDEASRRALSECRAVLVGGQALPGELRGRARDAGIAVVETYGSSETAGGCVWDGQPLDGVELRLGADDRLWISGPMLARGYVSDNGSTDGPRTAERFVVDGGRRWYRSDDRAELHLGEAGLEVSIRGRSDSVLISGGLKLDVAEVQRALNDGLVPVSAIAIAVPGTVWGESLGIVVLVDTALGDEREAELERALVNRFGPAARPLVVSSPEVMLPNGKPDLRAYRALLVQHARERGLLATMDDDDYRP